VRILIIEDEKKVASFIAKGLQEEGYAVDVLHDGESGAFQALSIDYDVVILDLMLPKLSGLEMLRIIRQQKARMPVLILTAKGELEDRVLGLNAGADDYLIKPFAFVELSARVRALLRRGTSDDTRLRFADLEIDTITRTVKRGGQPIELKPREYALLEFLMRNAGRTVTRTMITEHVWDIHFDSISNVVDVHINSLRNKIDKEFPFPLIHTVRGVGYRIADQKP